MCYAMGHYFAQPLGYLVHSMKSGLPLCGHCSRNAVFYASCTTSSVCGLLKQYAQLRTRHLKAPFNLSELCNFFRLGTNVPPFPLPAALTQILIP